MSRNKIIVNADDYGIDENRTRAILESFKVGAINQTTALVNMPYFETAARQISDVGLIGSMGLHLNLTEGVPITEAMRECRLFCDDRGMFTGDFHRSCKNRLFLSGGVHDVVHNELKAQIERFVSFSGVLMHVDSHHHVHTDFSIARILMPLLVRYGFKSIRRSRNFGSELGLRKKIYKIAINSYLMCNLESTDIFCSFGDFKNEYDAIPNRKSIEVMVHPMYGEPNGLDLQGRLTDSGRPMGEELEFYNDKKIFL